MKVNSKPSKKQQPANRPDIALMIGVCSSKNLLKNAMMSLIRPAKKPVAAAVRALPYSENRFFSPVEAGVITMPRIHPTSALKMQSNILGSGFGWEFATYSSNLRRLSQADLSRTTADSTNCDQILRLF